ncbi:cell wall protein Ecm33 [Vermiconidia calcicola]|uniref:Cell wall protein Ecm33 n=1 Tax=Vermiconidia calcicola TaxID=1690605 RepID=A0ACC3N2H6_9PEZI|nr:cell wall protein Ecm33 [Vermiconidia calcicola]
MPELQSVGYGAETPGGFLAIKNCRAVKLPLLEEVKSAYFDWNSIEELSLPSLRRVGEGLDDTLEASGPGVSSGFHVTRNLNLRNMALPRLENVSTNLFIEDNGLQTVSGLPRLSTIGNTGLFNGSYTA